MTISEDTSLLVDDSTILTCVGFGTPDVEIDWRKDNGPLIQNSSSISVYQNEVTQGGRLYKKSFLEIFGLMTSDSGNYTCRITNGQSTIDATTQLVIVICK